MHHTGSHANGNLSSRANAFSVESLISSEHTNQQTSSTRMAASTGRGSPENSEQGDFFRQSGGRSHTHFSSPAKLNVSSFSAFRSGYRSSRFNASHAKPCWIYRNFGMRRHHHRTANEGFVAAFLWAGHRNDNYQSRQVRVIRAI